MYVLWHLQTGRELRMPCLEHLKRDIDAVCRLTSFIGSGSDFERFTNDKR
jgi:hypothetical protein